jgi:hypothetical protein
VATKANTANCWGNDKKKGNHCWAQRTYFVPQIEEFTLLLDHAVRTNNGVSAAGSEMFGQLKYCNGSEVVPNFTPNGLGYYTVKDLLAGATIGSADPTPSTCGLNLDDPSVVAGSYSSARYDGIVLQIQLDYSNSKPWSGILPNGKVDYVLTTSIVNNTKSKIEEEIWYDYPNNRITRNRHGIKIIVIQSGSLGSFSTSALLTTVTSSLALLAVATTGVDFLAMYVLARKGIYKQAKYENVNEKYLEQKEQEEARREANYRGGQQWTEAYQPPETASDTLSESLNGARVNPASKPSGRVDEHFQWS